MKVHSFAVALTLTAVMIACQNGRSGSPPSVLVGIWQTRAPDYEECSMEIKNGWIIFKNGQEHMDAYRITSIEQLPDGSNTLYTIHYESTGTGAYALSLAYQGTVNGEGVIRFQHQKDIVWKRTDEAF